MPSGYNEHLGESAYVFHSYEEFKVDLTGRVWSEYYKKTLEPFMHNGQMCVAFPGKLLNRPDQDLIPVSILNVVALAYKTPWFNLCEIGERVNAIPIDGNPSNVHPSNLLWQYPDEGLEHPSLKGFYYIPGFSEYLINKEGVILNAITLKEKQPHIAQSGYWQISITGEAGNSSRSIHVHRLLGLTFIPYPVNVKDLVINHKDLNKRNNDLSNLEWVSQYENVQHYLRSKYGKDQSEIAINVKNAKGEETQILVDLSNHRVPHRVDCKDLITSEVMSYNSIGQAASTLGLDNESVRVASIPGRERIIKNRYIFKRENGPWPDLKIEDIKLGYNGQPRPVLVKELSTGKVSEFPSAAQAIRDLNVSKKVATKNLKASIQKDVQGYVFQYKDSLKDWEL